MSDAMAEYELGLEADEVVRGAFLDEWWALYERLRDEDDDGVVPTS